MGAAGHQAATLVPQPSSLVGQQPRASLSKNANNQLKKQVVQFCWQNLMNACGPDKLKLDIKGKAVTNHPAQNAYQLYQQQLLELQQNEGAFLVPYKTVHSNRHAQQNMPMDVRQMQLQLSSGQVI